MTTKRAHGRCTCGAQSMRVAHADGLITLAEPENVTCSPDCPSLYPAQQEPDALTRLVRLIRESDAHPTDIAEAMDLIAEARTEARDSLDAERLRADAEGGRARDLQNDLNWLQRRINRIDDNP
jgi:hypothetical protein